jgi:CheY-like chemotaxis protein
MQQAAALTSRLLTFARRQTLQTQPVVLKTLIQGMGALIRSTVGPSVRVMAELDGGEWTVLCDPNQLESALLNLAINARDAMPDGGTLTIGVRDVHLDETDIVGLDDAKPGDYVMITVADTGTGMDEVIQRRVFEPFFTTKPLGQGTGLGLSQLYGFVRQSDGIVRLASAPGQGTIVSLYLPRNESAGAMEAPVRHVAPTGTGGTETVLLVEDESGVRATTAQWLRELGYSVVEAGDGPEALRLLRSTSRVDVLVTDVGLPNGLNGRQIAEFAREHRPGLPVLFITGYAGAALEGQLASGMQLIGKPFELDALALRVRDLLTAG